MGRRLKLRLAVAVGFAACLCGCRGCGRSVEPPPPEALAIPDTVRYCAPARLSATSARVQVLVDGSGSMAGFRAYVPQLSSWTAQALSAIRNAGATFESQRNCYFRAGEGIANCSASGLPVQAARGDTNLHEAIASARSYDLTIVFTDGVAATGTGTGDCAGGVDAACVGRAIAAALAPRAGDPQTRISGAWLLPLIALFDGPLYTEQPGTDAFQPDAAAGSVASETATTAQIGKAGKDSRGALVFPYTGPKAMFALVIAREAEMGRALVGALAASAEAQLVSKLDSAKQFERGLAMLAATELYPGYVPPLEPGAPEIETQAGKYTGAGTVDVAAAGAGAVSFTCPAGENSAEIGVPFGAAQRVSGCFDLQALPPREMEIMPASGFERVEDPSWVGDLASGSLRLTATVRCDGQWQQACNASAPAIVWAGVPRFDRAADRLNDPQSSAAASAIVALSTNRMAEQPHRIFGLKDMLEKLYRELESQRPIIPFARLSFCRK